MRKILYFIAFAFLFMGCEEENRENEGTGLESLSDFNLIDVNGTLVADPAIPNEEYVVSWTPAESGLESPVIYTWQAASLDGSLNNPDVSLPSDGEGKMPQITFTSSQLVSLLEGLGIAEGESITLKWSVTATNGDFTKSSDESEVTMNLQGPGISPFYLLLPSNETYLELDIDNPDTKLDIEWQQTQASTGESITYTWEAVVSGESFDNPIVEITSNNGGEEIELTLTHQQLDDVLESNGISVGAVATLDWRVRADADGLTDYSQDIFTVSIKRFNPVPGPENLYLVGGSTSADWNPSTAVPFVNNGDGTFEIYAYITVDGFGFKLLENQENYNGDWGKGAEGEIIQEGESNFDVPADGFYRFTVNFNDLSYSLTESNWAIIGSGTPNGWNDPDTDMTFVGGKGSYTWSIDVTLTDGELKFRSNDSWDINFGDNGSDGSLEYGGSNIPVSAGNYTVILTLDPVNGYTYSIN